MTFNEVLVLIMTVILFLVFYIGYHKIFRVTYFNGLSFIYIIFICGALAFIASMLIVSKVLNLA